MPLMQAPDSGVTVRMYRQGHGDCFLLAFRDDNGDPFYLLIDCGYKGGSQIDKNLDIEDFVAHIGESTGHHLHRVLITHEHEDHVNGFGNKSTNRFEDFTIDELWLAWTEDPDDDLANELRDHYQDTLYGLLAARDALAAAQQDGLAARVSDVLDLELEDDGAGGLFAAAVKGETCKRAIQHIRNMAGEVRFLRPHEAPVELPGVTGVKVYPLGPPRDEELLLSLNPVEDEDRDEGYVQHLAAFAQAGAFRAAAVDHAGGAFATAAGADAAEAQQPFARRHRIPEDERGDGPHGDFFAATLDDGNQAWRRIDHDWLNTAEQLALRLNDEVNNTSLVVAIELPNSKRVLLFTGDAQRGSWVSWDDGEWDDGGTAVTARELLGRTVLYKVGHHGSHNATLKGYASSDYANLNWMARGGYRDEFVAMIPANEHWAVNKSGPWIHPLPSIRRALDRKAKGRVFQTDIAEVRRRSGISDAAWDEFQARATEEDLYLEYEVRDD